MHGDSHNPPVDDLKLSPPSAGRNWNFYSREYNSAFLVAGLIQFFFLVFAALMLDGGHLLRTVCIAALGHWAAALIVLLRRRTNPTPFDIMLVKYGFLAMLVIVYAIGPALVRLLGLER
jgi:hypothetical protein